MEAVRARLAEIGVKDSGGNLRNKVSRGGFRGAFLIQCQVAFRVTSWRLGDYLSEHRPRIIMRDPVLTQEDGMQPATATELAAIIRRRRSAAAG